MFSQVSLVCKQIMSAIQTVNAGKYNRDRYESDYQNRQAEGAAGRQRRVPVRSPPITYTNTLIN